MLVWIVEDGKKRIKMKTMTEISHVLVFVACTYVTSNSTVFERFCMDSRKRIETPVMWTRIDRCISVDGAKIGNGNGNAKKHQALAKQQLCTRITLFVHFNAFTAPLRRETA